MAASAITANTAQFLPIVPRTATPFAPFDVRIR
jgi:hypothetical protein